MIRPSVVGFLSATTRRFLREIDSVFVTFGRPDSDPSHPEGSSLMYAYLRGQPNHP